MVSWKLLIVCTLPWIAMACGPNPRAARLGNATVQGAESLSESEFRVDDMILFRSQTSGVITRQTAAGFLVYEGKPWPGGILPIKFKAGVSDMVRKQVFSACAKWSAVSPVKCVSHTNQAQAVLISTDTHDSCWSYVGARPSGGDTQLNLGTNCQSESIILHELGHALGLLHEHQRSDRDLYVQIKWENVEESATSNFKLLGSSENLGPYDFMSIMHYSDRAFLSKNSTGVTISPLPQYEKFAGVMGTSWLPTETDGQVLSRIYDIKPRTFNRADFLDAMIQLDQFYTSSAGLKRPYGLSYGAEPDFLGIAAWIFDIYLASVASGYSASDSFYNVKAHISHSEEWRSKHPGEQPFPTLPISSKIQLDRSEYLSVMRDKLSEAYRTELLRPEGLSIGNKPDFQGIAAWIFDIYLNARLAGNSKDQAWNKVLLQIRASDEYKSKH